MEALSDDQEGSWNSFVSSARNAGLAPCDRDCEYRVRCFNDRVACKPFERWVHGGGRVFPSSQFLPNRVIYDKIFPNDKQPTKRRRW